MQVLSGPRNHIIPLKSFSPLLYHREGRQELDYREPEIANYPLSS